MNFANKISSQLEQSLPHHTIDIFSKDSLLKTCLPYYLITVLASLHFLEGLPNPILLWTSIRNCNSKTKEGSPRSEEKFSARDPHFLDEDSSECRVTLLNIKILDLIPINNPS